MRRQQSHPLQRHAALLQAGGNDKQVADFFEPASRDPRLEEGYAEQEHSERSELDDAALPPEAYGFEAARVGSSPDREPLVTKNGTNHFSWTSDEKGMAKGLSSHLRLDDLVGILSAQGEDEVLRVPIGAHDFRSWALRPSQAQWAAALGLDNPFAEHDEEAVDSVDLAAGSKGKSGYFRPKGQLYLHFTPDGGVEKACIIALVVPRLYDMARSMGMAFVAIDHDDAAFATRQQNQNVQAGASTSASANDSGVRTHRRRLNGDAVDGFFPHRSAVPLEWRIKLLDSSMQAAFYGPAVFALVCCEDVDSVVRPRLPEEIAAQDYDNLAVILGRRDKLYLLEEAYIVDLNRVPSVYVRKPFSDAAITDAQNDVYGGYQLSARTHRSAEKSGRAMHNTGGGGYSDETSEATPRISRQEAVARLERALINAIVAGTTGAPAASRGGSNTRHGPVDLSTDTPITLGLGMGLSDGEKGQDGENEKSSSAPASVIVGETRLLMDRVVSCPASGKARAHFVKRELNNSNVSSFDVVDLIDDLRRHGLPTGNIIEANVANLAVPRPSDAPHAVHLDPTGSHAHARHLLSLTRRAFAALGRQMLAVLPASSTPQKKNATSLRAAGHRRHHQGTDYASECLGHRQYLLDVAAACCPGSAAEAAGAEIIAKIWSNRSDGTPVDDVLPQERVVLVTGKPGSGKTTVLAVVYAELLLGAPPPHHDGSGYGCDTGGEQATGSTGGGSKRCKPRGLILGRCVGHTGLSRRLNDLLASISRDVLVGYGLSPDGVSALSGSELSHFFALLINILPTQARPLTLVLDGIDNLVSNGDKSDRAGSLLEWLPASISPHTTIVISTGTPAASQPCRALFERDATIRLVAALGATTPIGSMFPTLWYGVSDQQSMRDVHGRRDSAVARLLRRLARDAAAHQPAGSATERDTGRPMLDRSAPCTVALLWALHLEPPSVDEAIVLVRYWLDASGHMVTSSQAAMLASSWAELCGTTQPSSVGDHELAISPLVLRLATAHVSTWKSSDLAPPMPHISIAALVEARVDDASYQLSPDLVAWSCGLFLVARDGLAACELQDMLSMSPVVMRSAFGDEGVSEMILKKVPMTSILRLLDLLSVLVIAYDDSMSGMELFRYRHDSIRDAVANAVGIDERRQGGRAASLSADANVFTPKRFALTATLTSYFAGNGSISSGCTQSRHVPNPTSLFGQTEDTYDCHGNDAGARGYVVNTRRMRELVHCLLASMRLEQATVELHTLDYLAAKVDAAMVNDLIEEFRCATSLTTKMAAGGKPNAATSQLLGFFVTHRIQIESRPDVFLDQLACRSDLVEPAVVRLREEAQQRLYARHLRTLRAQKGAAARARDSTTQAPDNINDVSRASADDKTRVGRWPGRAQTCRTVRKRVVQKRSSITGADGGLDGSSKQAVGADPEAVGASGPSYGHSHLGPVSHIAVSPLHRRVLTCSVDGTAVLSSAHDDAHRKNCDDEYFTDGSQAGSRYTALLLGHVRPIACGAICPLMASDGQSHTVVTAHVDGSAIEWAVLAIGTDAGAVTPLRRLAGTTPQEVSVVNNPATSCAYTDDGAWVGIVFRDGRFRLWAAGDTSEQKDQVPITLPSLNNAALGLCLRSGGIFRDASSRCDNNLTTQRPSATERACWDDEQGTVSCGALAIVNGSISAFEVVVQTSGLRLVWTASSQPEFKHHRAGTHVCCNISRDGRHVAVGCEDGTLLLWKVQTGDLLLSSSPAHSFQGLGIVDLAIDPRSSTVVAVDTGGLAYVLDYSDYDATDAQGGKPRAAAGQRGGFHTDGNHADVKVLSAAPPLSLSSADGVTQTSATSCAIDNRGHLICGRIDGSVAAYDFTFCSAHATATALSSSADGSHVAVKYDDWTVKVWTIRGMVKGGVGRGEDDGDCPVLIERLATNPREFQIMCCSLGDDVFVAGTAAGQVVVWNLSGQGAAILSVLLDCPAPLVSLGWSLDLTRLYACTESGCIMVWSFARKVQAPRAHAMGGSLDAVLGDNKSNDGREHFEATVLCALRMTPPISFCTFLDDSVELMAASASGGGLVVWDTDTATEMEQLGSSGVVVGFAAHVVNFDDAWVVMAGIPLVDGTLMPNTAPSVPKMLFFDAIKKDHVGWTDAPKLSSCGIAQVQGQRASLLVIDWSGAIARVAVQDGQVAHELIVEPRYGATENASDCVVCSSTSSTSSVMLHHSGLIEVVGWDQLQERWVVKPFFVEPPSLQALCAVQDHSQGVTVISTDGAEGLVITVLEA